MGRHKELACPQCGFIYAVNASEEVESRDRSTRESSAFRPLRQLPLSGTLEPFAELQRRPHPGDDVPVRPAFPAGQPAARALGRGRLPVSRRAGSQLHQAAGRPARRDDSHLSWRHLRQAAGRRHVRSGSQAVTAPVGDADRCLRRPAPAAAPSSDKPEWQRWTSPERRLGAVQRGVSRYQTRRSSDEWSELRYRHLVPEPEQWDAVLNDRHCRASPAPRW